MTDEPMGDMPDAASLQPAAFTAGHSLLAEGGRDAAAGGTAAEDDPFWAGLRHLTAARIGLKRAGASLATAPLLEFRLAHARARDAVHEVLDETRLGVEISTFGLPVLGVASAAPDRQRYLMRPNLGRRLAPGAEAVLGPYAGSYDVVFVIADGLSACAVQAHAHPVLAGILMALQADGWRIAPLVIARHGRVALGDAIAARLGADSAAVLIGERPGLTAPDSMGAYLTWQPRPETTDAGRNCISNIRLEGIGYVDAAFKIAHLLRSMRERRLSGVLLKDDSDRLLIGGRQDEGG
jgi:ethanolamine ammonia-lyase small subunit